MFSMWCDVCLVWYGMARSVLVCRPLLRLFSIYKIYVDIIANKTWQMPSARKESGRDKSERTRHRTRTYLCTHAVALFFVVRFSCRQTTHTLTLTLHFSYSGTTRLYSFLFFSFIRFYFSSTSTHLPIVIYNSSAKLRTSHFSNLCKGMFSYRLRHCV